MLLSEIIYNIKNLISGGINSDDLNIRDSQFAFIVSYYRNKLLKQDQDKGRVSLDLYKQNLGKVEIVMADKNDCCDIDACILRTKYRVPKPTETNRGLGITFVGLIGGMPFQKELHNSVMWGGGSKYTSRVSKWYYRDGYIYLVNPPTNELKWINIEGIFEKPEEAIKFRTCDCPDNEENCFDSLDFEYPLPAHHTDTVVKMIADTELKMLTGLSKDDTNNGEDELLDPSK